MQSCAESIVRARIADGLAVAVGDLNYNNPWLALGEKSAPIILRGCICTCVLAIDLDSVTTLIVLHIDLCLI